MPPAAVRRAFPDLAIGVSRHTVDGVRSAKDEGADFVVLGPIFDSPGKESRSLGLETLARAAAATILPLYAVGGIVPENARVVRDAGAAGIAAIRPFLDRPAEQAVRAFREALA